VALLYVERAHMVRAMDEFSLSELLLDLGRQVRDHVIGHRDLAHDHMIVGHEGGDTIFALDRRVEPVIEQVIVNWPSAVLPLLVVAEGFGADGRRRLGPSDQELRYRILIDPIDGTRGLMYDKRSAWFLATIAPDRGDRTQLSDGIASAMVELPTSKQSWCDVFSAAAGEPSRAWRERTDASERIEFVPARSREAVLLNGFAYVVDFFPGIRRLAADLMETIAEAALGPAYAAEAVIFSDQWVSTGGQMAELMVGHDRFCCDLRPLFFDINERRHGRATSRGLACHPYDIAGMLVAQQAGVVLTDGWGQPLDAPFTVDHGVHWCGYANEELRSQIEPVIQSWLRHHL
jgi:fructose-1,6-bisphosphatase/inositol monophosphatase family enzyme